MKTNTLWTKDFSLITGGTIISAIGGEAINLPLSLMVFDETQSTFLSALLLICGMIPDIILPIFIAPLIDRSSKKPLVVGLDFLLGLLMAVFGVIIYFTGFQYILYLVFCLLTGTVSVIYRLAYDAWYPDIIPLGFEQKGYAVSTTLYPTVMIVMSPVAAFMYQKLSMSMIFFIVSGLLFLAVLLERQITKDVPEYCATGSSFDFHKYFDEIKEGFRFLKKEKGIRNIYTYMSITNGVSYGGQLAVQAYFQTAAFLSVTLLGFLKSAETIGRMIGGIGQYKIHIPAEKRYGVTKFVYVFYEIMDMMLLFIPYPLMLINRFLCGFFGITSATIRETAVQSYLPKNVRAKVNAVFSAAISACLIVMQLLAGWLGEWMDYRYIMLLMASIALFSVVIFIILPSGVNQKVYEATRKESYTNLP